MEYKNIANQSNTTESPLYYVPSPANFKRTNDTYDGLHPNPNGEFKIATGMWNQIQYLVGAATPSPSPSPIPVPKTPTINTITDVNKSISGNAAIGGVVTLTIGTKKYVSKVTASSWKITLTSGLKAGTKVSAIVTVNKKPSLSKSTYVVPAMPKVNLIKANTTSITGTATKGASVIAVIGSKTYTSKANLKTGAFTFKISKIKQGTRVTVKCKTGGQTS